jgi:hypothetical protein
VPDADCELPVKPEELSEEEPEELVDVGAVGVALPPPPPPPEEPPPE